MGKEWYRGGSKSASSSKRGGGVGGGGGGDKNTSTATPGCMSAVFQFFDHFQFPLNQHQPSFKPDSYLPDDRTILKGVEAPRNNLELEETPLPSTSCFKEEENLNISMGIQIKTRSGDKRSKAGKVPNDSSSEISSSPGAKTPTLVARLMGLDLLPDSPTVSSPSFHETTPNLLAKSNLHHQLRTRQTVQPKTLANRNSIDADFRGTRSLPETPRTSSARRSDVDHHRLSLQINKENIGVGEELDISRFAHLKRKELKQEDENRSPSHYARQIVRQVKESVSRKVGLDITNTLRNRETVAARGEILSQLKAKKSATNLSKLVDQSSPGKYSTPSCSPRLSRFLEPKEKPPTTSTTHKDSNIPHQQPRKQSCPASSQVNIQPQAVKVLSSKPPKLQLQAVQEQLSEQRATKICKKVDSERFNPRLKKPPKTTNIIRNKQEEPFVRPPTANRASSPDKECKKTPLSNDLLNITVTTLLPLKKDPSPPATKIPQKQVLNAQSWKRSSQLSSTSSQTYKHEATGTLVSRDNYVDRGNGVTTTTVGGAAEYEYVTRILRRTGIDKDTPVSFINWFSPSHPLNPFIFHHLENTTTLTTTNESEFNPLSLRCNRKLVFHLVDEMLTEILKPFINMKPWIKCGEGQMHMQGSELIDMLCLHIKSFPCADCRVHIDGLIKKDLTQMKARSGIIMEFEEEGEGVVMEIEKEILDTLIHETVVAIRIN